MDDNFKPNVLVVLITKDYVEIGCLDSVIGQTYPNYSWMIHGMKPVFDDAHPILRCSKNCAHNREAARHLALASDADYFLFMDSDIVLPPEALERFIVQVHGAQRAVTTPPGMTVYDNAKEIIGGWYKMRNSHRWVCGHWVDDNLFVHCQCPEPSLTRVDMVGLGCCLISRNALSDLCFEHGTDKECKDDTGRTILLEECAAFSNLAANKGYCLYMDGSVICQHLERAAR
jgi:hypothetical protein